MYAASFSYDANMKTKIASSVAKTERRKEERSREARETCNRCQRPPALCVCQSLPEKPIITSTHVLILQHPRERRRKSLSTTPLVNLVLDKCTVKCGYNFKPDELDLVQECFAKGRKPLLLFPDDDSITIDQEDLSNQSSIIGDITLSQLLILVSLHSWKLRIWNSIQTTLLTIRTFRSMEPGRKLSVW